MVQKIIDALAECRVCLGIARFTRRAKHLS
jgi:hypothetical protein